MDEVKKKIIEAKLISIEKSKENYYSAAAEIFFLTNGGNILDFESWKASDDTKEFLRVWFQGEDALFQDTDQRPTNSQNFDFNVNAVASEVDKEHLKSTSFRSEAFEVIDFAS